MARPSDEELARRGREQLRHGHYAPASETLSAYCSRMIAQDRAIGASVMTRANPLNVRLGRALNRLKDGAKKLA